MGEAFYKRHVRARKLSRLTVTAVPVLEKPVDGYPADFRSMLKAIKQGKRRVRNGVGDKHAMK